MFSGAGARSDHGTSVPPQCPGPGQTWGLTYLGRNPSGGFAGRGLEIRTLGGHCPPMTSKIPASSKNDEDLKKNCHFGSRPRDNTKNVTYCTLSTVSTLRTLGTVYAEENTKQLLILKHKPQFLSQKKSFLCSPYVLEKRSKKTKKKEKKGKSTVSWYFSLFFKREKNALWIFFNTMRIGLKNIFQSKSKKNIF